ncbi:MAG: glycosyltransferase, partial [Cyanothece sp. SIO1E1]|nr:glycosyltransferase [Cyanothece sp. SIO1E1]
MSGSIAIVENLPMFAGNMRSRLRDRTLLFRYLFTINLIFGAWYLQWRITSSINFNVLWLSVALLLAEIYCYCGGVMFFIGLWRPIVRQVKSLKHITPSMPPEDFPTVDIFITCYNEPADMVKKTARAALALDYPPTKLRVYILDDGNSPAMRTMVEELCLVDLQSPLLQQEAEKLND